MKRLISFILIFSILLSFGVSVNSEETVFEQSGMEFLLSADYDKKTEENCALEKTKTSVLTIDDEHKNSLALDSAGGVSRYFASFETKDSMAALVSFDVNFFKTDTRGFLKFIFENSQNKSENVEKIVFVAAEDATLSYRDFEHGWTQAIKHPYSANEWRRINIWIDYFNRKFTFFLDGKEWYELDLMPDMGNLKGVLYQVETINGGGTHALDNFDIVRFYEKGNEIPIDNLTVLEGFEDFVEFEPKSEFVGNNHFSKNIAFCIDIESYKSNPVEAVAEVEVVSESGRKVFRESKDFQIQKNEEKSLNFSFIAPEYGFYDLNMKMTDKATGKTVEKTRQLAVINGPEKGKYNPKMGICNHTHYGSMMISEKVDLMAAAGISAVRGEVKWEWFQNSSGEWGYNRKNDSGEAYDKLELDTAYKNGQRKLMILLGQDPTKGRHWQYGDSNNLSPDEIIKFEEYCYKIALDNKGRGVDYEIWNEFNLRGDPSPEVYVEIVKSAYKGVKRADPEALVYGLGGVTNVENMISWTKACLELGMGEYCDGVTIHPYAFTNTPEGANSLEKTKQIRDLMDEHNMAGKPIIASEFGWSGEQCDDNLQADYMVRFNALSYDVFEKIFWYVSQEKQLASTGENRFGWTRAYDKEWAEPKGVASAKPVFLAAANYNTLMTNAKSIGKIDIEDKNTYIYQFETEDNSDCLIMWNIEGERNLSLNLGTDKAVVYDLFGNDTALSLENSVLDVKISGRPIYVKGNFSSVCEVQPQFKVNTDEIKITANDYSSVIFETTANSENLYLDFVLPDSITVAENNGFKDGKATVKFNSGNNLKQGSSVLVYVRDKLSGEIKYSECLDVLYLEDVTCESKGRYFRNGRWQVEVTLRNNKSSKNVSGVVYIKEPAEFDTAIEFSNIPANGYKKLYFNVAENLNDAKVPISVFIETDDGKKVESKKDVYMTAFSQIHKEPKIDGIIEKGEYNESFAINLEYQNQVQQITDWRGKNDLSGIFCANYDKDCFYLSAIVTDDIESDYDVGGLERVWACDSIQLAFTNQRTKEGKRTEYSFGIVNGEPRFTRHSFMVVETSIVAATDNHGYDGIKTAIVRDEENKKTYYEIKIPWVQIYGKEIEPKNYKNMNFSLLLNDNDGKGRRGWIELCSGIGVKDPELFAEIPVVK